MAYFVQQLINGIALGSIYGLIAIGLSLVFGVMRVINIAHGDLAMLGAYVAFFAWTWFAINPLLSLLPAMVLLFLVGAALQRLVIERVVGRPLLASLMLTFGLSLMIWNSSEAAFTTQIRGVPYLTAPVTFLGVSMSRSYVVGFGLATLLKDLKLVESNLAFLVLLAVGVLDSILLYHFFTVQLPAAKAADAAAIADVRVAGTLGRPHNRSA